MATDEPFIRLAPAPSLDDQIQAEVIARLELLLAEARRGEISGFVGMIRRDAVTWEPIWTGMRDFMQAIGAIELLKQRWVLAFIEHQEQQK